MRTNHTGTKRIIALALSLLCVTSLVFADVHVRMAPVIAADFAARPTIDDVSEQFGDQGILFWGPQIEILSNHGGFGFRGLVNFDSLSTDSAEIPYNWTLDWLGEVFLSYHIFGSSAFIDPFLEVGFGNGGRVDIEETPDEWVYDDYGTPHYDSLRNLSLYPAVAVGLNIDLNGFFVGTRVAYRPTVLQVPATQFEMYPLKSFQVSLHAGIDL